MKSGAARIGTLGMEVRYANSELERLERDASFTAGLPFEVATAFRRRMEHIRQAPDVRDLRAMRSMRFEKLRGKRQGQHSIRVHKQFRLIFTMDGRASEKVITVLEVEDYH